MSIKYYVPFLCLCATALLLAPAGRGRAADAKDPPAKTEAAEPAAAPLKKVKQLSAEMAERRDHVRRLLAALRKQPFNTQQNTCGDVLDFCRAFGCETELTDYRRSAKLNGITCLCWNMPCGGYELLTVSEGHLAPRVGYGYQDHSSELAAVLALAHVPAAYPARAGKTVRTVADLIEYEKLTCRPGLDMSLKLVALANYVKEPSWKDSLGGEWTLQRVVAEELIRPAGTQPHSATNRLLGLAPRWSVSRPTRSPWTATWNGRSAISTTRSATPMRCRTVTAVGAGQRTATTPGRRLHRAHAGVAPHGAADRPAGRAANRAGHRFPAQRLQCDALSELISTMSPREISAAMHAGYVLNVYDRRVFAPADPPPEAEPVKTEKAEQKSAGVPGQAR